MLRLLSISCLFILQWCSGTISGQTLHTNDTTVLYIFTGSDWCVNCHRLEKNVLSDSAFINTLAANKVIIERIDFPQSKKQLKATENYNRSVAEKLGFNGTFPTMVIATKKNDRFRSFYYNNETTEQFITLLIGELKKLHE